MFQRDTVSYISFKLNCFEKILQHFRNIYLANIYEIATLPIMYTCKKIDCVSVKMLVNVSHLKRQKAIKNERVCKEKNLP